MLVFNPTLKKRETRKFTSFYRGPYTIVEFINDSNFKVGNKKTTKTIKVRYDRPKKHKTRENHSRLSLRQNEKQQFKVQKKLDLNSSDDDGIIETESSTDRESNLNTEIQSEADDANNSLNVTNDTS